MVLAFLGELLPALHDHGVRWAIRRVAEIFRAPDLHAVLFFAFFILTDPPTSPIEVSRPDHLRRDRRGRELRRVRGWAPSTTCWR